MCASGHKLDTDRSAHSSDSVVTAIEQPQNMLWLKQEYARLSKPIKKQLTTSVKQIKSARSMSKNSDRARSVTLKLNNDLKESPIRKQF